jgi:hypothetical protein
MPRRIPLLVVLVAGLVLAVGASAAGVQMKLGDSVDVLNTKIGCFMEPGDKNQRTLVCELATTHGAIKGTYGIGISAQGDTVVSKVNNKGTAVALWAGRVKASARMVTATYFQLKAGDAFGFPVGNRFVGCNIIDLSTGGATFSGRRVVCFRSLNGKPLPNSFGVVLSDKFVGSFRFKANGDIGPNAYVRLQPK